MSNRRTHLFVGALVGSIGAALHPRLAGVPLGQKLLVGGSLGAAGALLPDLLEPADSPFHRDLAHSAVSLGVSTKLGFMKDAPFLSLLALGYASHLVLDSGTPAGLPLLVGGA